MTDVASLIATAASLWRQAQYTVALTGAGISTPSGIPDFRTPESGVWAEGTDPMAVASIYAFKRRPQDFFDWLRPLAKTLLNAEPNAAHYALARLEQAGRLRGIITQNIDLLHSRAGAETIYEVHGHIREATCIRCYEIFNAEAALADYLDTGAVPHCPACGGVLKPNVILFGEMLPTRVMQQAKVQTRRCDLMLVAGSSLEVAPAGDLPLLAKQTGADLIIVNLDETHVDEIADVVIRADVVDVLPSLAEAVLSGSAASF